MGLKKRHLFGLLAIASVVALLPIPVGAAPTVTTVTTGLDSPRGVTFLNGKLLVAEAGNAGDVCHPIFTFFCIGLTGKITEVDLRSRHHRHIVTGLISTGIVEGEVLGVSGLSSREGEAQAVIGEYPQFFANLPFGAWTCNGNQHCETVMNAAEAQLGSLIEVKRRGYEKIAGVGANDFVWTVTSAPPGQDEKDSNPYGVLMAEDRTWLADAGSNILVSVNDDGKISIKHWFDKPLVHGFPHDAVPTCVANRNGGLFVGQLSGRAFQGDGTNFAEINLNGTGHHITGCTTDRDGNVLFVNMWDAPLPSFPSPFSGSIVKLDPAGNTTVLASHLNFPNMIAVGPDGGLYVTINSTCSGNPPAGSPCDGHPGSVVRVAYGSDQND